MADGGQWYVPVRPGGLVERGYRALSRSSLAARARLKPSRARRPDAYPLVVGVRRPSSDVDGIGTGIRSAERQKVRYGSTDMD